MKIGNVLKITKSHLSIRKLYLIAYPAIFSVVLLVSMSGFYPSMYKSLGFVIFTAVFVGCVPIGIINRVASYDKKQGIKINRIEYFISLIIFAIAWFFIGIIPFAIISGFVGKRLAGFCVINLFGWIVSSIIGLVLVSMSGRWCIALKLSILGVFLVNIINYAFTNDPFNINSTFISKIMTVYYVEQILNINHDLFNNYFDKIPFGIFIIFINLVLISFAFSYVYRKNQK